MYTKHIRLTAMLRMMFLFIVGIGLSNPIAAATRGNAQEQALVTWFDFNRELDELRGTITDEDIAIYWGGGFEKWPEELKEHHVRDAKEAMDVAVEQVKNLITTLQRDYAFETIQERFESHRDEIRTVYWLEKFHGTVKPYLDQVSRKSYDLGTTLDMNNEQFANAYGNRLDQLQNGLNNIADSVNQQQKKFIVKWDGLLRNYDEQPLVEHPYIQQCIAFLKDERKNGVERILDVQSFVDDILDRVYDKFSHVDLFFQELEDFTGSELFSLAQRIGEINKSLKELDAELEAGLDQFWSYRFSKACQHWIDQTMAWCQARANVVIRNVHTVDVRTAFSNLSIKMVLQCLGIFLSLYRLQVRLLQLWQYRLNNAV